jgi:hypothetical protein
MRNYTPEFGGASPSAGWQEVEIVNALEDETNNGNERLTISVRCENGAEVKYAHSVIMGYDWSNRRLTELLLAFHCPLNIKSALALKNRRGEVYLWKMKNSDGKGYWKIRNMRVPEYEGKAGYETWYKETAGGEEEKCPSLPDKPLSRKSLSFAPPKSEDGFPDDIPF